MDKLKQIDKATTKFKFVSRSKNKKFRFLPEWISAEADYFYNEVSNGKRKHKIYKRGALVFVDFGINVGNELSGNHFAIVLNKHDSYYNGVLTVIPVSSKSNKFSVELDGFISDKSLILLDEIANGIAKEIQNLTAMSEDRLSKLKHKTSQLNAVISMYSRFDKISYAKCLDIRTISKDRIKKINSYDPVGNIFVSSETLTKIDNMLISNFTNIKIDKINN